MKKQQCFQCGMAVPAKTKRCPKCDNRIARQTDGSTVKADIAHHGERVQEAVSKMHAIIDMEKAGLTQYLRLVVGGGAIREAAEYELITLKHRRAIKSYAPDGGNTGAFMVRLK